MVSPEKRALSEAAVSAFVASHAANLHGVSVVRINGKEVCLHVLVFPTLEPTVDKSFQKAIQEASAPAIKALSYYNPN